MVEQGIVPPHGGRLIDRTGAPVDPKEPAVAVTLTPRQQCDWEMIAIGAMSPREGFMPEADCNSVCEEMKLSDGTLWPMPITCAVDDATAGKVNPGDRVALKDDAGRLLGYLSVSEKYKPDKRKQAVKAFGTDDVAHPGVKVLMEEGDTCLAGAIDVTTVRHGPMFPEHRLTPAKTRAEFERRGWKTVVAFQTRNPIHRAHEYITKCAQELVDGLLIHPLMGATKDGDISPEVRMKCYEVLIENYYNTETTMLSIMPAAMRYAGPREAILHAILRQNYGCSHLIVGRDHAGVGDYYGTYDAQRIFDTLPDGALHIQPMRFEHAAWSKKAGCMVSRKSFPAIKGDQIFLSGTKVRELLSKGERPPVEFTRTEVAEILIDSMKNA